ncbi:hypothetical protein [Bifidobacterium sp. ESL0764]|uniref:hypothetical protein n=1 Tax=Bifidobacterium sp. ESL0764 TaxID=2983228 RepID=UPI0023F678EA|nr:hypothetical protein [Bifidobacterium sp. ESL0764]WEV65648.1 hypothetical protein OZX71_07850 [Bifidobacterium sp. ESL0764]
MDSEEIEKKFGYTPEQLDEMAAEYESGEWEGPLDYVVQLRPITPEMRKKIDEIWAGYKREDAEKSTKANTGRKLAAAYR